MPRNVALSDLLETLRAELRESPTQAVQQAWVDIMRVKLSNVQKTMWLAHNWPHLTIKQTIPLTANTRYYDVPRYLTFEGITRVDRLWQRDEWEVPYGIYPEHYSQYNSDVDPPITAEPVLRWDIMADPNTFSDKIEVWPIPASDNSQSLLVTGKRDLPLLSSPTDVAVLDDLLLVYEAAAEILDGRGAKDAKGARDKANAQLKIVLSSRQSGSRAKWNMRGEQAFRRPGRLIAPYTPRS